jgi:hypothetical protein
MEAHGQAGRATIIDSSFFGMKKRRRNPMYQHPATLDMLASAHREDMLRDAHNARLVRLSQESDSDSAHPHARLRLVAASAAAVLAAVAAVVVL